jgi:phosphohistidine phosphatase
MMLYLVQHGEAKSELQDPERSLTEDGIIKVRKVASYITSYTDTRVHTIFHSGKKRAQQTAELFAEKLKPPKGVQIGKELSPNSLPWGWVERLVQMQEDIMIVGHLPHLQKLSALLLCQDENKPIIKFYKGGVVSLYKNESGIWSILWVVTPQIISVTE